MWELLTMVIMLYISILGCINLFAMKRWDLTMMFYCYPLPTSLEVLFFCLLLWSIHSRAFCYWFGQSILDRKATWVRKLFEKVSTNIAWAAPCFGRTVMKKKVSSLCGSGLGSIHGVGPHLSLLNHTASEHSMLW